MRNIYEKANSEKEISLVVTRSGGHWEREFEEGGQKVQTSSYKISRYTERNVQHDDST